MFYRFYQRCCTGCLFRKIHSDTIEWLVQIQCSALAETIQCAKCKSRKDFVTSLTQNWMIR